MIVWLTRKAGTKYNFKFADLLQTMCGFTNISSPFISQWSKTYIESGLAVIVTVEPMPSSVVESGAIAYVPEPLE